MNVLTPEDFQTMFGGPLDLRTAQTIGGYDWRYRVVDGAESNRIVLGLLRRAEHRDFTIAGENIERWQKGWSENLEEFKRTGDVAALEPKYLRPSKYLRLNQQFIEPADPMFERNWYRIFRAWFARRYLAKFDCIYEFGCGSGHNVAWLAQEFPDKMIWGFDWASASVEILDALNAKGLNVYGAQFDFFSPPRAYGWAPNTAVLTVGALEQTGLRWRPFLDFLRRTQPAMCFHIEPILEWYDPENLIDHTAIKAHEARGFWRGFVDEIKTGRKHRTGFGSLLLEGYSQLIWEPSAPDEATAERARIDALEGAP